MSFHVAMNLTSHLTSYLTSELIAIDFKFQVDFLKLDRMEFISIFRCFSCYHKMKIEEERNNCFILHKNIIHIRTYY